MSRNSIVSTDTKVSNLDTYLTPDLVDELVKFNQGYLLLLKKICKRDPVAAINLGISDDLVPVFANADTGKLLKIGSVQMSLLSIRFYDDLEFWKKAIEESLDRNEIVYKLLEDWGK